MKEKPPFFSVVIITYNRLPLLKKAVESIKKQTDADWELIVVDNHSSDGTQEWLESEKMRDSRTGYERIHNHDVIAKSRNLGIKTARGRYVAFLDSDDEWMPEKLAECRTLLEQYPDAAGVCHGEYHDDGVHKRAVHYGPYTENLTRLLLTRGSRLSPSATVIKTETYRKVGGFEEDRSIVTAEDYDTWIKLSREGKILYLPKMLGVFAIHSGNMSGNLIRNYVSSRNVLRKQVRMEKKRSKRMPDKLFWLFHQCFWELRFLRMMAASALKIFLRKKT